MCFFYFGVVTGFFVRIQGFFFLGSSCFCCLKGDPAWKEPGSLVSGTMTFKKSRGLHGIVGKDTDKIMVSAGLNDAN